jgi:multidrug efflux pump subunit AcrA (membrane-fusion protein)
MIRLNNKILALLLLAGLTAACAPGAGGKATPTPLPPLVSYEKSIFVVERGSIVSEKKIVAEVVPNKQDELFFRSGGYVTRVAVKAGDVVKKGDVLAELDVNDLLNQLQQARIDLEVAQADLAKNKAQHAYDVEKANADVIILQKQVELGKIAVQTALGLEREKAQLNLEITQQNLAVAQKALEMASQDIDPYLEQAVKRSQLAVERLEGLVSEKQIVAPYDGTVLKSAVRAGQQVDAYFSAFSVGDPSTQVLRAAYDSDLSSKLTSESGVTLLLTSDAKEGYKIKYLLNFRPERGVQTTNQQTDLTDYLYFSLPTDLPKEQIPMGRSVFISVVLGKKDGVLLLPPAAIREYKDLKYVIVMDGDKRRRVEVNEIGLRTADKVEVTADLKEGDKVLGP